MRRSQSAIVTITCALTHCVLAQSTATPPTTSPATQPVATQPAVTASQRMRDEAAALRSMMASDLGRAFLDGAANLPSIAPRAIYRDKKTREWLSESQKNARLAAAGSTTPAPAFDELIADEDRYYDTKYGSPVAYARAFDILGQNGLASFESQTILDIGYGTVGHLRMLASQGVEVIGLDVDSFLTALYCDPADTGIIVNPTGEADGHITLVNGRLDDPAVRAQAAKPGTLDLIISKNTLKRGYIHPPPNVEVDPRTLVDLGLDDAAFLKTLHDALKPGGLFLIYNICPKQSDYEHGEKFIPWADGRCPFEKDVMQAAGFDVVILDRDDSEACRQMAHILGWDQGEGAMKLDADLFAHFTLLRKQVGG